MSFIDGALMLLLIFRKITAIQLQIDQKITYHYLKGHPTFLSPAVRALFKDKDILLPFILELVLAALHPNILTKGMFFMLHDEHYNLDLK